MTYREALKGAELKLQSVGIEDFLSDAWILFEFVSGMRRAEFFAKAEETISEPLLAEYERIITIRCSQVPVQYITGHQEFMGMDFCVNENVLIPRQDTERLVEEVIKVSRGRSVLDMCTGSGCIAISLAALGKPSHVVAADISSKALETAIDNAERLLGEKDCSVSFIESDMFTEIKEDFDIIVSNPPYIKSDEIAELMSQVKDFEPLSALDGHSDGLYFYRSIAGRLKHYLKKGGYLFLEIGCEQAQAVTGLLKQADMVNIRVIKDYAGLDRVIAAERQ